MRTTVLVSGIALFAGSAAFAAGPNSSKADQVVVAPVAAAPVAASGTDWSGPYAGAFLGYGMFGGTAWDLGGDALDADGIQIENTGFDALAGLTLGYNWQRNNLVFGIETDYGFSGFSASDTYDDDYRTEAKTESLFTIRGRIGLAADDTLFFATAGYGRAQIYGCASDDEDSCDPDDDEIVEYDDGVNGYVVGFGVEHALANSISLKAEYLYFDSEFSDEISYDSGTDDDRAKFSASSSTVRFGMNYRF